MANKQRVSTAAQDLQDRMHRVTALAAAEGGNPDVRPRGKREQDGMWAQVMGLPVPERAHLLTQMVARSGHTDDEERPCDLCKFVSRNAPKG